MSSPAVRLAQVLPDLRAYSMFDREAPSVPDRVLPFSLPVPDGRNWSRHAPHKRAISPITASVALHLLLLVGLLISPARAPFGAIGAGLGTGMRVSLVAGFAAGGAESGSLTKVPADVDAEENRASSLAEPLGATSSVSERQDEAPQQAQRSPRKTSLMAGANGEAADAFEGVAGASGRRGGDPLASSDLLGQIARCLPPGMRPSLAFSQLTLSIGGDGRLRAAPEVTSQLPRMTPGERAAADRIVQAALLCGPYAHPDVVNRVVSLVADFSAVNQDGPG